MAESSNAVIGRTRVLLGGILAMLLLGGVIVLVTRSLHASALESAVDLHATQYVTTITPAASGQGQPLTLPGTLQGVIESTVYARTNGYVLRWFKDIGASVKKGEVLAEISAPEIDQELSQAIAARGQAAASAELAKSTAERWKALREKDAVTQQDMDERASAYNQAAANLAAAEANVSRLKNLTGYNKVVAPFDGVVTRRNIDVGDLVNAGNGGTGQAMFSVAQVDPLRLYIYVPQAYATQVKVGSTVKVRLQDNSGEAYEGTVARTARAIDTATRTMQVEIQVPNPKGALLSGAYVEATLPVDGSVSTLVVPTNVLLFRPEGMRVAVVGDGNKVHLVTVKLGTDFGDHVEVLSGLARNDRVVLNPADSLADGDVVSPVTDTAPAPKKS